MYRAIKFSQKIRPYLLGEGQKKKKEQKKFIIRKIEGRFMHET
ncbi:uncharacterized protein J3R85_020205 [Psidium guajava]|nr:uncharacterized protein J3R85_020205 [Psidium guajava]